MIDIFAVCWFFQFTFQHPMLALHLSDILVPIDMLLWLIEDGELFLDYIDVTNSVVAITYIDIGFTAM